MPNKGNLRKWVAALRSGRFKQGRRALVTSTPDGPLHCCLGVACEVALAEGLRMEVLEPPDSGGAWLFDGNGGTLPLAMSRWLGVRNTDPAIGNGVQATHANDSVMLTFEQIADAIEKYYGLNEDDGPAAD